MFTAPLPTQTNEAPISDAEFIQTVHLVDSVDDAYKPGKGEQEQHHENKKLSVNEAALNIFETVLYSELSSGNISENRLILPLYLENKVYDALINPGATASFIDINVVKETNLNIKPAQGNIYLGHKHAHVA